MDFWAVAVLAVIALAFAAAAVVCIWYWHKQGQEIALMAATETSRVAELSARPVGSVVELKGILRCHEPLTAEFSGQPSVWYRALIEREIVYYQKNSKGQSERRTRREKVSDNVRSAACTIEDDSGSVALSFHDATVEAEETVRRYDPAATSAGSIVGDLVGSALGTGSDRGLHYTETALLPDRPIYVLGTVLPGGRVGRAQDGRAPFVISYKSEEERARSLGRSRLLLLVAAAGCILIGVGVPLLILVLQS